MTTETAPAPHEQVDLEDASERTGLEDFEQDAAYSAQQPHSDDVEPSTFALFPGDRGELSLGARKALVRLLKDRFISAEEHPEEWAALLESEAAITSRLNDLFLELRIDRERETAWKDQAEPDGGGGRPFPTLLYRQSWNREATIALVYLRRLHAMSASAGRPTTFVDREAILEAIDSARPAGATDHVGDARRAAKAVEDIYSAGLLVGRKTDDSFKVSRAIESLLTTDQLTSLLASLEAESAPTDAEPADAGREHPESEQPR